MTVIIAVTTPDYIILASDRRLTKQLRDRVDVFDDDTCKLVAFCNSTVIGYTGRGFINEVPTYKWIAQALQSGNCTDEEQAINRLVSASNQAFKNIYRPHSRHLFVVTGWTDKGRSGHLQPFVCPVSNYLDRDGNYLAVAEPVFHPVLKFHPPELPFAISIFGIHVPVARQLGLRRKLRPLIERRVRPAEVVRILVQEIGELSRLNATVGKKVLACCIPKNSVSRSDSNGLFSLAKPADHQVATFSYFNDRYAPEVQHGPAMVCGTVTAIDTRTTASPNGEQSSQATIRMLQP